LDQFPSPLAALILGHNHQCGLDLCLDAMKPGMTIWCDLCGNNGGFIGAPEST
jgi:hypothetical protein